MLRLLVLLLVIANAAFYGWRQGWLDDLVGVRAQGDREPGRLALQVEPQRVRVLSTGPAKGGTTTAVAAAEAPTVCLEVGPYTAAQLGPAQSAIAGVVPPERIEDARHETPAAWIVFMGPYTDADTRRKKVDELRRLKVTSEEVRQVPELGDGLALGRFDNRAAAERALADVTTKGVRTARLAQLVPPVVTHTLRIAAVSPELQQQLVALQVPGLAGKSFAACARP
ncbi:hypothetical protein [Piscinibacter gummiphilus]|uniref:Uncharacterized protein n=1 Tax=Piscinibacter gummiphilus TaxID=946333 RepID=A0A1W6LG38_9BURK|nr:hypothetical protein [Piscinibacter gummiphilus]ARN23157.1 hypothetical protein A4W93_26445 [Piscinibacter gummiphilus]ATU67855.1 hypothetical protein CPZ87_26570 [Piscinibacter gummiphilus]GLS97137.1 hypothetical protein GCM10007918_44290 [Piscinibacter gummiphilus]